MIGVFMSDEHCRQLTGIDIKTLQPFFSLTRRETTVDHQRGFSIRD
jgi:hypothetical protein